MTDRLWILDGVRLAGRPTRRLDNVSLSIASGVTAVVGYSGAGKTSLLNLLVGFEAPDAGQLSFPLSNQLIRNETSRLAVFWVPQDDGLWPGVTVRRHLELVASPANVGDADELLDSFDLVSVADATPDRLSRGEASRLATARAIASGAAVLVLDEPLAHVDPARRWRYWDRLIGYSRDCDASLVFSTHEPADVLRYAHHVIGMSEGRVVFSGSTTQLYDLPPDETAARLLGPTNWLDEATRDRWQISGAASSPCIRPERLAVEPAPDGAVTVIESRQSGAIDESELRCNSSGDVQQFVHRTTGERLTAGTRVRLTVLAVVASLAVIGCSSDSDGPELPIASERSFALPADEASLPAPRDIALGHNDEKIVLDNAGRVLVYDSEGKLDRQWDMPESSVGNPEGTCVLDDGRICVADTHYHRIVYFDQQGEVLGMFGELGKGEGQFIYPVAVTTDSEGNLYVAEYGGNDRIQKFAPSGEYLTAFGSFGTGEGQFQRPSGIVWLDGKLYVLDAFNSRIHVFSDSGEYQGLVGTVSGGLHYPYDLSLGPDGRLYIVEYGAGRVTLLSTDGDILGRYGTTGSGRGHLATPWGLAVDSTGRIWIADTGNRRVVELVPEGAGRGGGSR